MSSKKIIGLISPTIFPIGAIVSLNLASLFLVLFSISHLS